MRDKARIFNILIELEKFWFNNPELRICQIMRLASEIDDSFYVEDLIILKNLRKLNINDEF